MRIISSFHDYYDSVRAYGVDPKLVYVREASELDEKHVPAGVDVVLSSMPRYFFHDTYQHVKGVVCFCGTMHPYVSVRRHVCYTIEDFVEAWRTSIGMYDLNAHDRARIIASIVDPFSQAAGTHYSHGKVKWRRRIMKHGFTHNINEICAPSWKRVLEHDLTVADDVHRTIGAPVFAVETSGQHGRPVVIVNPVLKNLQFFKRVSVTDAYQRLTMYVGNNLVVQKDPDVGITDEMRAQSAGFDEWSFRRHRDDPRR